MAPAPHIDPNAVCEQGAISLALDVPLASLLKARRDGELRFVRRGRRVFITDRNLPAWLEPSDGIAERGAVARD